MAKSSDTLVMIILEGIGHGGDLEFIFSMIDPFNHCEILGTLLLNIFVISE